jgi:phosphate transport system substrate-binding protein
VTAAAWIAVGLVLHTYEYLASFSEIDNVVGMIPVALMVTAGATATILAWIRYEKRNLAIIIVVASLFVSSIALFPNALIGNWWIYPTTYSESQTAPDLSVYAPFTDTAVAGDEQASLRLGPGAPVLDGATALYPMYAGFANAVYEQASYSPDDVRCTNTVGAYSAIVSGDADIIFVAAPSAAQLERASQAGVDLVFTPIGREAFVFLVGSGNPITTITSQQIRNIYSGKTTQWSTLGWPEGGRIIAFQRPEGSGSQTGLGNAMGQIPIQVPQPLPDPSLIGTNSLMNQISLTWQGVQPALGYSYRYFATTMYPNPDTRLLAVDGIEPTNENIAAGTYPFIGEIYAVTRGAPQADTKLLIDWILSAQGQLIVQRAGYSPI